MTAWGVYQLGQVQRAQGRQDAAVRTYQQTLAIAAGSGSAPAPPAGSAYVGLGEVTYQRNELDSPSGGPGASRYAASSSTPHRWPLAW